MKKIYLTIGIVVGVVLALGSVTQASYFEQIMGWIASGSPDTATANPVKIGCHATSTPQALADEEDVYNVNCDTSGQLFVTGTLAATQSGTWNIGTLTTITNDVNIADNGNSITVDAVNLDIRDIASTTDDILVYPGNNASWVVTASQLDIDDLASTTDNITSYLSINGVHYDARDRNWTITETIPVTITGTSTLATENTLASALTALQIIDDWDDANYANVNLNYAGTDAATGGGTEAGSLRVTLASDSTGVVSIDDNGGSLTIDGSISITGTSTLATENTLLTIAGDTTSLDGKDLALGTDISDVFGTASLILATQADNVVNTSDGLQTTGFNYVYDGSTWDRLYGDSTNGVFVNLKASTLDLMLGSDFSAVFGSSANSNTNPLYTLSVASSTQATVNNIISYASSTAVAITDGPLVTVGASTFIAVKSVSFTCDNANSVDVAVRIGLGSASVPAYGSNGIVLGHPGVAAGSGVVETGTGSDGIIAIGAAGDDLRITNEVPTGGSCITRVTYYTY